MHSSTERPATSRVLQKHLGGEAPFICTCVRLAEAQLLHNALQSGAVLSHRVLSQELGFP